MPMALGETAMNATSWRAYAVNPSYIREYLHAAYAA